MCVGGGAGVLEEVQVCWRRCRCVGGAGVLEVQVCWGRCRCVGGGAGVLGEVQVCCCTNFPDSWYSPSPTDVPAATLK